MAVISFEVPTENIITLLQRDHDFKPGDGQIEGVSEHDGKLTLTVTFEVSTEALQSLVTDRQELITPVQLASELGHEPEHRPGKKVRDYLRKRYPDHTPNQRWLLTKEQADDVRSYFASKE